MTNTPERLTVMVAAETPDYLGDASPGVAYAVVGSALVVMFLLVASCWVV